jgi:predicted AAA+ superfamily ATPase
MSPGHRVQSHRHDEYDLRVEQASALTATDQAPSYRERIAETLVEARLRTHGAVLLTGPKAVGKTTTARCFAASEVRLDQDHAALTAAQTDPRLVLDGEHPRLIDEYQLAPGIWNAVRGRIDDLAGKGLFLLAGSSTPESEEQSHTGARRIAAVQMRTMTLLERGISSGAVSLSALLDGSPADTEPHRLGVTEAIEALSIGGWPDNLSLALTDALEANADYLDVIVHADVHRVDGIHRDPDGVRRLLASYARNVATSASLRTIARTAEQPLGETTLRDYLRVLGRLFLIEDQPSWKPALRSRIRLAATPKRHLADPSLAVAALGATPQRLLGPEIKLAGFLFESQTIHDLRVYAQPHRGEVRFYRDNKGLEIDSIVETPDGRWLAAEIKLGHHRVDEAAHNLLALRQKLSPATNAACGALLVIVADSPTYTRPDGVIVTSIASLGP